MSDAHVDYWVNKLQKYAADDWSAKPSLFAQDAIKYFPPTGRVLELGAGLGQDGRWFAEQSYEVVMTDMTDLVDKNKGLVAETKIVDMSQLLPFVENSFDVVYSHLALHYFPLKRTHELLHEIYTCLKPGGTFAFLVNSVHDPESKEGEELESNYRRIGSITKRYFDLSTTKDLTHKFDELLLDDNGTSFKDRQAGMEHLIRFIGRKPK